MKNSYQKIAFLGLGYVGLCTAAAFAARGFAVTGVDVDSERVQTVASGKAPFHEPGLDRLLKKAIKSGRLRTATDVAESAGSRFVFITVGTPSSPDGAIDLRYVIGALDDVGKLLGKTDSYSLVVLKSTVVPGTSLLSRSRLEAKSGKILGDRLGFCVNPEFLKEGSAIKDTEHPDKIVIGSFDKRSGNELNKLYRRYYKRTLPPLIMTNPQTAEMVKYASNAFLATKISFINTMANICRRTPETDVEDVARAIGLDPRIGPLFLKAGPGYGGSCFHKDLQAIIRYSESVGYEPRLLQATEQVNQDQPGQVVQMAEDLIGGLNGKRIAVLGLAFKKDTDDIREAASLRVIDGLRKKGAVVSAYDPMAINNAKRMLEGSITFANTVEEAIEDADGAIVMTEWGEFQRMEPKTFWSHMRAPNVVDARRIYDPARYGSLGFVALGIGPRTEIKRIRYSSNANKTGLERRTLVPKHRVPTP